MSLGQKRVLITGGSGFIGSHLCEKLLTTDNQLTLLVRRGDPLTNLAAIRPRLEIIPADLTNLAELTRIINHVAPQYVFHLAADTRQARDVSLLPEMVNHNLAPTINLVVALAQSSLARFIVLGTSDIYGHNPAPCKEDLPPAPISPYAVTKAAALLFARYAYLNYKIPTVMLIPFMVYGPRQSKQMLISQAIISALKGEDFRMTEGEQLREFNYVEDIVSGLISAATAPDVLGETINLCGGERLTVYQAVSKVMSMLGTEVKILRGALPYRENEIMAHYGDAAKACALLGYTAATPLEKGLAATISYFKKEFNEKQLMA